MKTKRKFRLAIVAVYALLIVLPAEVIGQTDSILQDKLIKDTLQKSETDTILSDTTVENQENASLSRSDSISTPLAVTNVPETRLPSEPVKKTPEGFMIGIGAGWSLGDFSVLNIWKKSLPGSLQNFGIDAYSFRVEPDTTLPDSLWEADTAQLKYQVKEKPNDYNMVFPIKLSFYKVRENDRFSASLSFMLVSKKFKASVFAVDDSLDRRVDIREKMVLYSLAVEAMYGHKIPERYFSINGVERSDFVAGIGIAPLVSLKTSSSTKLYSDDLRISAVNDSIVGALDKLTSYGISLSFRAGISTIRKLESNSALEIWISYNLNWYNYFYSNNKRIFFSDIDRYTKNNKELSFLSNRFEITFSLLRNVK